MADAFKSLTGKGCCPGGWKCRHCGVTPGKDRDMERRRALKVSDQMHIRYDLDAEYLHPAEIRMYAEWDGRLN
jgi:hypothetical protein